MSESTFDPAAHMIELPGRGRNGPTLYLPVAARIAWFRVDHPDGKLHVWKDQIDERIAIFHAQAETADGAIAQGWGSETPQDFKDYIEKASTKAVGRALAALGYGTLQAGDELDEGARIVDTPQARQDGSRATTTPRAGSAGPGREAPAPRSAPQRPAPSDRPAAVPSAAGPPSPGKATAEELEELSAADFGWTEFWSWARQRGYSDRTSLDAAVGRPTNGMTPVEIRAALRKVAVPA